MPLKLKTLKTVKKSQPDDSSPGDGNSENPPNDTVAQDEPFDPGEGPSTGPVSRPPLPSAEPRTRHHIYNQTVVQGW